LLIHIGFHKTGTTYLQRNVFTGENGYSSPWSVSSGEAIEYFILTHERKYKSKVVRDQFTRACDDGSMSNRIPVISHEDLSGYPIYGRYYGHQVASRIKITFPDAKILICIREQKSMIRSLYGQYINQGGEWPLSTFLGDEYDHLSGYRPIFQLEHLEYDLIVKHYQELFGVENVLVLPYELLKENSAEFEKKIHLFSGGKCNTQRKRKRKRENVGYLAKTLQVNRLLNKFFKRPLLFRGSYGDLPILLRAKNRVCRVLNKLIPKFIHVYEEKKLSDMIDSYVGDYYKESNQKLSKLVNLNLEKYRYDL